MSFANIIGGIIFSAIGLAAFIYGKKQSRLIPMVIGLTLMGYTFLISNTLAIYGVGAVLTLALFLFRE